MNDRTCIAFVNGRQCNGCYRCYRNDESTAVRTDCSNADTPMGKGRASDQCVPVDELQFPLEIPERPVEPTTPTPPTTTTTTSDEARHCFETKQELEAAIDLYISNNENGIGNEVKIGDWCVDKITDFSRLFSGRRSFNEPLNNWATSQVTNMDSMFRGAEAFDQDLSHFDTSSVTSLKGMFTRALSFNKPLYDWNVDQVEDFSYMFYLATAFDQNLCSWDAAADVGVTPEVRRMFARTSCATQDDPIVGTPANTQWCQSCSSS